MIISLTPDYTPGYTSHYTPGLMKDAYDGQETGAMTGCNGTMPTGPYICCGNAPGGGAPAVAAPPPAAQAVAES